MDKIRNVEEIIISSLHKQEVGCPGMFVYFCDREGRQKIIQEIEQNYIKISSLPTVEEEMPVGYHDVDEFYLD